MAFKLKNPHKTDYMPSNADLSCYDTIIEGEWGHPDEWDYDQDVLLHVRSYYEFIRDQLSDEQRTDLDMIDAFWKSHPEAFNKAFGLLINQENLKTAMEGFGIIDMATNKPPIIPKSHWWWRKLEVKK